MELSKIESVVTGVLGEEFMIPEEEEPLIWGIDGEYCFKTMPSVTGPIT